MSKHPAINNLNENEITTSITSSTPTRIDNSSTKAETQEKAEKLLTRSFSGIKPNIFPPQNGLVNGVANDKLSNKPVLTSPNAHFN